MARLITLGVFTGLLALFSVITEAAYINYGGCIEGIDCYGDLYNPSRQSDPYSNPYHSNSKRLDSGYASEPNHHPWLTDSNPRLDSGQDDRKGLDPDISSFISDFQNNTTNSYSRSGYASFSYKKTSGFKETKLSYEDLERIKSVVDNSHTPSRASRDLLKSVVKKDAPAKEKLAPPGFFSFELVIAFHVLLFFVAFIFFKIDDRS